MMERLQAAQRNQVERVTRQMENMKIEMPEKYKRVKDIPQAHHTKLRREGPWRRAGAA
jgi:hypothetical protein